MKDFHVNNVSAGYTFLLARINAVFSQCIQSGLGHGRCQRIRHCPMIPKDPNRDWKVETGTGESC